MQLAKKYHPDVNKTKEASQKFQEISEAYEVCSSIFDFQSLNSLSLQILSDEKKRKEYDMFGSSPPGGDFFSPESSQFQFRERSTIFFPGMGGRGAEAPEGSYNFKSHQDVNEFFRKAFGFGSVSFLHLNSLRRHLYGFFSFYNLFVFREALTGVLSRRVPLVTPLQKRLF